MHHGPTGHWSPGETWFPTSLKAEANA